MLSFNGNLPLQVHSTIENAILPSSDEYGSTDDVLSWLQTTLTNIWVDPVCGDGVCETPFEFAAYGRFGCRADCGQLAQIQNLTTLQIDLYYDFSHPSGSVSATVRACPEMTHAVAAQPAGRLLADSCASHVSGCPSPALTVCAWPGVVLSLSSRNVSPR